MRISSRTRTADSSGYAWSFDPQLPGLLRDYRALGYRLIGILAPSAFGLELDETSVWVALYGDARVLHFDKATEALGNAGRGMNRPRPGLGWLFWPQAQITSPRLMV